MLGQCLYNRYFHPLHLVPGPVWGSLTDFYHLYLMWRKTSHTQQLALHQKYGECGQCILRCSPGSKAYISTGPVVRLSPNMLTINDPSLMQRLYRSHTDKTPFYSSGIMGEEPPVLQIREEKPHSARLKTLAPSVISMAMFS